MSNKPSSKILLGIILMAVVDLAKELLVKRESMDSPRASEDSGQVIPGVSRMRNANTQEFKGEKLMDIESQPKAIGPGLLIAGMIGGGLIGAALAFWYAPQSGRKTQTALKREAGRLHQQINKKVDKFVSSSEALTTEAAERAAALAGQSREFVSDTARTLRETFDHKRAA